MSGDSDEAKLARFFEGLGASAGQARTMAAQTLKRARQLSQERGISEVEALDYLLRMIVAGRAGETPDGPDRKKT